MKLIVGLGNPGSKYENTRHNAGFMVVDALAYDLNADLSTWGPGKTMELAQTRIHDEKVLLVKPLTFMNLSGQAVVAAAMYFKIAPDDICVVHDEVDVALGSVRLKIGGGDGGHNGLKSLTSCLSSPNYSRIRFGVGRPPHPEMDVADFVLGDFKNNELEIVDQMIDKSIAAIQAFCKGVDQFKSEMNTMNRADK